jgi:hypothetical protein
MSNVTPSLLQEAILPDVNEHMPAGVFGKDASHIG